MTVEREVFLLQDVDADIVLSVGLPAWSTRANCYSGGRGEYLERFFAENTSDGKATGQVYAAKRQCSTCPVRPECLQWAMDYEQDSLYRDGIFGGLDAEERTLVSQAVDPLAFGLHVLDEQVRIGLITPRVERFSEVAVEVQIAGKVEEALS